MKKRELYSGVLFTLCMATSAGAQSPVQPVPDPPVRVDSKAEISKLDPSTPAIVFESKLGDDALAPLSRITGLRRLDLIYCTKVTDRGLATLAKHPSIEWLYLSTGPTITDKGMAHLASMPSLQSVNLSGLPLTSRGLQDLARAPKLTAIDLDGCIGIDDAGVLELAKLPLRELNLSATGPGVTGRSLGVIASLKSLQKLRLSAMHGLTAQNLAAIAKLPALESLDVSYNYHVDGVSFVPLSTSKTLRELHLRGVNLGDGALSHMVRIRDLRRLDIGRAKGISATGLATLRGAKALEHLDASGTPVDAAVVKAWTKLPKLARLELRGCSTIDVRAAEALARLPHLTHLALRESSIDDAGLAALAASKSLVELDLVMSPARQACRPAARATARSGVHQQLRHWRAGPRAPSIH